MIEIDAKCSCCSYPFRWVPGTPLRCPICTNPLEPQFITWGEYLDLKTQHNTASDIADKAMALGHEEHLIL